MAHDDSNFMADEFKKLSESIQRISKAKQPEAIAFIKGVLAGMEIGKEGE